MGKEVIARKCLRCAVKGIFPLGIVDYIYGCWWKCRSCGFWYEHIPSL